MDTQSYKTGLDSVFKNFRLCKLETDSIVNNLDTG